MRLDKYLANSGIGTRKEVKKLISKGLIKVNNIVVKSSELNVDEVNDEITYNNKKIYYTKYRYIMLNKPKGFLSATFDKKYKTVLDLVTEYKTYKLFPVGRLDIDTEGLILLTNDGILSHNLLSPKKHIEKKYYVELENSISEDNIKKIENGVYINNNYLTKPSKIEKLSSNSLYISITEGKFHQIKEMFRTVDNRVIYLKRIMMGNLKLDENLKLGEYRELTKEELELLI